MIKSLETVGAKTGLKESEVRSLCKLNGWSTLKTVLLLLVAGCSNKTQTVTTPPSAQPADDTAVQQPASAIPALPSTITGNNPAYPAGTRYATVAMGDFRQSIG